MTRSLTVPLLVANKAPYTGRARSGQELRGSVVLSLVFRSRLISPGGRMFRTGVITACMPGMRHGVSWPVRAAARLGLRVGCGSGAGPARMLC